MEILSYSQHSTQECLHANGFIIAAISDWLEVETRLANAMETDTGLQKSTYINLATSLLDQILPASGLLKTRSMDKLKATYSMISMAIGYKRMEYMKKSLLKSYRRSERKDIASLLELQPALILLPIVNIVYLDKCRGGMR